MIVIGVTGRRYSGKSLAAAWIAERWKFRELDFTKDVLAPMLVKQKKQVVRETLVVLAMSLRKKYGTDVLAKRISPKADGKNSVISGIRFPEEVRYFRKRFGKNFILISVESDSSHRWKRAKMVKKGESRLSYAEFVRRDRALVTERPIPRAMAMADFSVKNNAKKSDLFKKIDRLFNTYIKPR